MRDTPGEARLMMEERNVDHLEGVRRRNVCRRLFQDDEDNSERTTNSENVNGRMSNGENDNLANRLFEEARQNRENAMKRWNFDFTNDVPLLGRYEWVRVDRDGNEIPDSAQSGNEVRDSQEEPAPEKPAKADAEKRNENDDDDDQMAVGARDD